MCCKCLSPSRRCPQQKRQIKMQVHKGSWLLLSTEGLKSQSVPCPEQSSVSYIAMWSKWLVVTEISTAERHGCSSLACFKTNTAAWCSNETELGYFHSLMVNLSLFNGQASPSFILVWCVRWNCSSSLSQWSIGCALVTLTHQFILRLPHALMTTLWGFGAYNVVLRKRNQYPGKPAWWAGSLRRNQKNSMEQVRPLSWHIFLCNTAAEFCLFSLPTKAFGLLVQRFFSY